MMVMLLIPVSVERETCVQSQNQVNIKYFIDDIVNRFFIIIKIFQA